MSEYVKHPRIKPDKMHSRTYQESILGHAAKNNLLCVLPTGLGKTNIAILLAVERLEKYPDSKILVLAPTRPLVTQHFNSFTYFMDYPVKEFISVMGTTAPDSRSLIYKNKKIIFATPQTIQHDLKDNRIDLQNFSLLVIDEAHHAIGNYAYPYIAQEYMKQSENPRILGLTASPGGTSSKIKEICVNLSIDDVEIRSEEDSDVSPYVKDKNVEWVEVELPERFMIIKNQLVEFYDERITRLKKMGFIRMNYAPKKLLLELQGKLMQAGKGGHMKSFMGVSLVSQAIKIDHALGLLETQGIGVLEKYWTKLRDQEKSGTKAAKTIIKDKRISSAMLMTRNLLEEGSRHPKMSKLCSIVEQELERDKETQIIIFANYRDSVAEIVSVLKNMTHARPIDFIGQREGMNQKEQKRRISAFRDGEYNVLVCTSVGEEGIDIPEMRLAIFYEPVPSEVRSIQRRGRVGRTIVGRIVVLVTKRTRDEAYRWTAHNKEKKMKAVLHEMKNKDNSSLKNLVKQ